MRLITKLLLQIQRILCRNILHQINYQLSITSYQLSISSSFRRYAQSKRAALSLSCELDAH